LQAISAWLVVRLTRRLASATDEYARTTKDALKLSADQFERDWRPDLLIAEIILRERGNVFLRAANLAKPAALITQVKIGTGGKTEQSIEPQDVKVWRSVHLVPGGQTAEVKIDLELSDYRQTLGPRLPPLPASQFWQTRMNVALVYDSAGKENQTGWFTCSVGFSGIQVHSVAVTD